MKIFMSYRRKDWTFAQRLAESLERHLLGAHVFVDTKDINDDNFNDSILRNLRESHCFVLIVSEHTFEHARINQSDDWVRREIAEALVQGIPVILALYENHPLPPSGHLPENIQPILQKQGIPFYAQYYDEGAQKLADLVYHVVLKRRQARRRRTITIPTLAELFRPILGGQSSTDADKDE